MTPVDNAVGRGLSPAEETVLARFDGRAYDWMNYRFDRQGYLPEPAGSKGHASRAALHPAGLGG